MAKVALGIAAGANPFGTSALGANQPNSASSKATAPTTSGMAGTNAPKPLPQARDTQGTFLDSLSNTAFNASETKMQRGEMLTMPSRF